MEKFLRLIMILDMDLLILINFKDIFFNEDSVCQENRVLFSDLAGDQYVNLDVKETERGLLAIRMKLK